MQDTAPGTTDTARPDAWTALVTVDQEAAAHLPGRQRRALNQGLALITLTAADWDLIGRSLADAPDSATSLDRFMAAVMRSAGFPESYAAPVLFIEIQGDLQSSVLFADRRVVASFARAHSGPDGPVNHALRRLGVDRGAHPDESAALGLRGP
ncbi:hypothetical protein [Actinacidiphila acidipaludis]|uniref:Uncharacterized protein n=1 Tax=Actinacidiphila acidipaludis TaxID=2873382 RepID=A0ABS7Q6T9_9ACTN|nr:hypothetical protein [Streptomyces acidipaludis]MBY8878847.1 hypothetical protein [Streptomyces acidipaludis]